MHPEEGLQCHGEQERAKAGAATPEPSVHLLPHEPKFAEQMNGHGLRRARYWGLTKVGLQAIVTATVTNLKRLAKLLAAGQGLAPQAA